MQCLSLSCHTFVGNLPQHIGHGHCPVLHLGLGCTADIPTQTDNLVIIHHLAAHGYNARILLRSLQANVEKEHIPAGLYLLAGIVYPAAVVLQRIQTAEIPGHAHPRHVIGVEFIFQHSQPRIAVCPLDKKAETRHQPGVQGCLLLVELLSLRIVLTKFGTVVHLPVYVFFGSRFQ